MDAPPCASEARRRRLVHTTHTTAQNYHYNQSMQPPSKSRMQTNFVPCVYVYLTDEHQPLLRQPIGATSPRSVQGPSRDTPRASMPSGCSPKSATCCSLRLWIKRSRYGMCLDPSGRSTACAPTWATRSLSGVCVSAYVYVWAHYVLHCVTHYSFLKISTAHTHYFSLC